MVHTCMCSMFFVSGDNSVWYKMTTTTCILKLCPLMAAILNFQSAQKHNFCRSQSNDHSCNVCFELLYWFQEKFFNIFPQGPMLKLCLLMAAMLNFQLAQKKPNFCRGPSNDNSCTVCLELVYRFHRRNFLTFSHKVLC